MILPSMAASRASPCSSPTSSTGRCHFRIAVINLPCIALGYGFIGRAICAGTEIDALLLSRNVHILRVADVILSLNIVIFLTAAFFFGVESATDSILTCFAASRALDFILHGLEELQPAASLRSCQSGVAVTLCRRTPFARCGRISCISRFSCSCSSTPDPIMHHP